MIQLLDALISPYIIAGVLMQATYATLHVYMCSSS